MKNNQNADIVTLKKYLIGAAIFLFVWVPIVTFFNSRVDDSNTGSTGTNSVNAPTGQEIKNQNCQKVRAEGERLDRASAELVAEAKRLQRVWIIQEMSKLKDQGKITPKEWDDFSTFMTKSMGASKIPILEVMHLMDKVVKNGYIKLYLPQNVVKVGTQAALSKSSSDYYVNYPECFSEVDNEMHKLVSELPESKGAWARKLDSAFELIP